MDAYSRQTIAEDLVYLASWGGSITAPEIRRGSAVLRRLLVEDAYGQAWRACGFERQPVLAAVDLRSFIEPLHPADFLFGLAAGAELRGLHMAVMLVPKPGIEIPVKSVAEDAEYPGQKLYALSEYLGSLSGFVAGEQFNRREVIKYIANVKGGVHLSEAERKAEAKLVERLGKIEQRIHAFSTEGLFVELLAIAQAVGRSTDARNLVKRINEA